MAFAVPRLKKSESATLALPPALVKMLPSGQAKNVPTTSLEACPSKVRISASMACRSPLRSWSLAAIRLSCQCSFSSISSSCPARAAVICRFSLSIVALSSAPRSVPIRSIDTPRSAATSSIVVSVMRDRSEILFISPHSDDYFNSNQLKRECNYPDYAKV